MQEQDRRGATRAIEDALRDRLDVSDAMHPDNPQFADAPRGTLWWQAASWLLDERKDER